MSPPAATIAWGRPGRRLLPALLLAAAPAALAPWLAPAAPVALALSAAVLIAAAAEAWRLGRWRMRGERPPRLALPVGRPTELPLLLAHDAPVRLELAVRQLLPGCCGGGERNLAMTLAPGRQLPVPFQAIGLERGEAPLAAPVVAWTAWGLWERWMAAAAPTTVDVIPDLVAVGRERRRLDALFLRGLGARLAPRRGQGREFDRLRDYVTGDDYRHIAWKATARRGRLTVREFRVERAQDVMLVIDRGHRMGMAVHGPDGPLTRLDHALNAALLTAWLAHRSEDRVGFATAADEVDPGLAPGRGRDHLAAITAAATRTALAAETTDYRHLAADLRRRLRHRTLVLLLTVLPEEGDEEDLLAMVGLLCPRHLPVILAMGDPLLDEVADQQPGDREGLCRTLVAGSLVDARRTLTSELVRRGALVAPCLPQNAGTAAVNAYLDVKRRQLL